MADQSKVVPRWPVSWLRSETSPECTRVSFYPCLTFGEQQG